MTLVKKIAPFFLACSLMFNAPTLTAREYHSDVGGCGYAQSKRVSCITPAVVLGAALIALIVAVALDNNCHAHSHCHSN